MLVSAERLHRFKCAFCGSTDKNIVNLKSKLSKECKDQVDVVKIVTCNQCGHTDIFGHSSAMIASILAGNPMTVEESDKFVDEFHDINHYDWKRNPHFGGNDYHDKPPMK